jgi:hypothetical protein
MRTLEERKRKKNPSETELRNARSLLGVRSLFPQSSSWVVAHRVVAEVNVARDAYQPGCVKQVQGVGRTSSSAEMRCAAAKWSGEVVCTEAQFNSTVVHFVGLWARYLTHRVYQIIETAWGFWLRDGLSRRPCNQIRCLGYALLWQA